MTRAELLGVDLKAYDCCRARCLAVFGFRQPSTGEWVGYGEEYRALSRLGEDILNIIQRNPGVYFDKLMLYVATGHEVMAGADANTHVYRLRLAHGERKQTEHFILTRDGGVAWRPDATWVHVVPILPSRQGTGRASEHAGG
ncbi:hypothetical protein ACFL09_00175 [Planctomycetota bacterium]